MDRMRKAVLIALALVLTAVAVLTWGSLGSLVMLFCLGAMGSGLLFQHFLINQEDPDFQMEV